MRIGVVAGSTRPNRVSHIVAAAIAEIAAKEAVAWSNKAAFDLLDIAAFDLPLLDEPIAAARGQYVRDHTKRWAEAVDRCDGFIFVTPEYNHSIPAALKNAIDFLYAEWADKPAGLVGYGGFGGIRAVEQLRLILAETATPCVRTQVAISPRDNEALWDRPSDWALDERAQRQARAMTQELLRWTQQFLRLRLNAAG